LTPWVPCIRALSFNHSVVMSSIMKHAGPAFTKGRALSSFLKTMFRIDVILLHVWDQKDDPQSASKTSDLSSNLISRHRVTDLLNAARTCLQRLSVSMLHENLALAIDVTLEHHNAHPILIILGACLSYIRSTLLPPHQHKFACSASSAAPSLKCSLCGASGIDSFHVDSASNFSECPDCHARRSGQRVPMRVCDVLGAYALQMLQGEIQARADHCKSLLHVFEIVYPTGQFSLSKFRDGQRTHCFPNTAVP